ncbi:uncharacterized protein LOC142329564 [Lycorma delicatula]|uniref:uncharacterized protein LOC142329564 n=1 Tax=Lycorma delicatula TaxID=130591 RepID=UPI003F51880F
MVVAEGVTLFWVTLMIVHCSLGGSATLCDLKACLCDAGGIGRLTCDCRQTGQQELLIQKTGQGQIPRTMSSITIKNCDNVHITENSLSTLTGLQTINLSNINNLDLDEHSFNWHHPTDEFKLHPGIKINILNTTIEEIPSYTFRGMIHTITIKNCTIEDVQVFSFASLINVERIDIIDTVINNIQPQAFKKFSLNSLIIYNSHLPILPTRSLVDVEVTNELRFENVQFDVIRSTAIKAFGMQIFRLLNNIINRLEKGAFNINTKGSVIFQNNVIIDVMSNSISEINVDTHYLMEEGKQDFTFINNSVLSFEDYPFTFNVTNFKPRIEQFKVLKQCTCNDIKIWITKNSLLSYYVKNNDKNDLSYIIQQIPEISSLINCKITSNNKEMTTIKHYQKTNCQETNYKRYIIMISIIIIIILVTIGLIILIFRNKMKRYINVPTTNGDNKLSYKGGNKNPIMIVPEGKTYRETELHVIVEQAEPIVEYVPPHKYNN